MFNHYFLRKEEVFLMQLSKAQKEAVETINGQVILISCPGSGKTSTVVRRVFHMVQSGIQANEILVLTFSKAAAIEMRERYYSLSGDLQNNPTHPVFATIHSFCYSVVAKAYNLSASNILKEHEIWDIISKAISHLKKSGDLTMTIRDYKDFVSGCIREISVINNNGVDWDSYKSEVCTTDLLHKIYVFYTEAKRSCHKIDFDDMLLICRDLFKNHSDYLEYCQSSYRYLIVDEYQDTNYLQSEILYMLAGPKETANICVVGDDDQSIYRFRGARPEIMLNFDKVFPECKKIYMDVNYRSEPEILSHAKNLISHNTERFAKDIKANKTGKGFVELLHGETTRHEINEIISTIDTLRQDYSYNDMAILYRNNKQANIPALMLMKKQMPFYTNEPLTSLYEHWIFHDLMTFYKLAQGHGTTEDLIQMINKPNRFVNTNCLKGVPVKKDKVISAVLNSIPYNEGWRKSKARQSLTDFFFCLSFLKDQEPIKFLNSVRKICGYNAYLKNYASYRQMDQTELFDILDSYMDDITKLQISTMKDWFAYAESVTEKIKQINSNRKKTGIALSTMHKSKGLEWPVVFILGANEEVIPSGHAKESSALEEERRLFYVAITRAKDKLFLSYSEGENPSPFLKEMCGAVEEKQAGSAETTSSKINPKKSNWKTGSKVFDVVYGYGTIIKLLPDSVIVKFEEHSEMIAFPKENKTLQLCIG